MDPQSPLRSGIAKHLWRRAIFVVAGVCAVLACTGEDASFTEIPATSDGGADGESEDDASSGTSLDTCDGVEVDFSSDEKNCGVCGRDCAGGACVDAVCQPVTIADNVSHPYGVTLGGTGIIWIYAHGDAGAVVSCPLAGCGNEGPKVITTTVVRPTESIPTGGRAVVSDGIAVHWIGRRLDEASDLYDRVYRCNMTACTPNEAKSYASAIQLSRFGHHVYYRLSNGHIRLCPQGTCRGDTSAPADPTVVGDGAGGRAFAMTNERLFYGSTSFSNSVFSCTRVDDETCNNVAPILSQLEPVSFLDVVGSTLYIVAGTKFLSCGVSGCSSAPTQILDGLPPVSAFVMDEANAYFAHAELGEIRACSLPSCAGGLRTIATGLDSPVSIALSDGLLYWANAGVDGGAGSIQKVRP